MGAAQVPTPQGVALFAKGDWAGAAREFQRTADAQPSDGRAWARLGSALHRMGKFEESARAFETAVKLDFQTPMTAAAAAREYAAMKQPEKSADWLGRA